MRDNKYPALGLYESIMAVMIDISILSLYNKTNFKHEIYIIFRQQNKYDSEFVCCFRRDRKHYEVWRKCRGYKPSNGPVHYADAPSMSFPNGHKFCKAVQYLLPDSVAPPQASPETHSAKKALCGTSAYSTSLGCLFAVGTTAFPLGAIAVGSIL